MKDLCLFLKNGGDRIDRVASFKTPEKGMINQASSRLVFIILESSVEEVLEGGCSFHLLDETSLARKRGAACGGKTKAQRVDATVVKWWLRAK